MSRKGKWIRLKRSKPLKGFFEMKAVSVKKADDWGVDEKPIRRDGRSRAGRPQGKVDRYKKTASSYKLLTVSLF